MLARSERESRSRPALRGPGRARVDVEDVKLKIEIGTIFITIEYTVRHTNSRYNLVYPFYINQGTNIEPHDKIY